MFHDGASIETLNGLKELRKRIEAAEIPSSKLDETLNIATWNIREFGKKRRSEAAVHYIAEIIGQFDLVSIVELRDDLHDLGAVLKVLGPYWDAVYSDLIADPGGNFERIGFVFDKRAVTFTGLAASALQARDKEDQLYSIDNMWWRQPYMASFSAGNFDFIVLAAHVRWGKTSAQRREEIASIADWLCFKFGQKNMVDKDWLVTGDFNISNTAMYQALLGVELRAPEVLRAKEFGSDLKQKKRYDQILHRTFYETEFATSGGVLDFYQGDFEPLFPGMTKTKATFQLSDHLPLWIQISTDNDDQQIDQLIRGLRKRAK